MSSEPILWLPPAGPGEIEETLGGVIRQWSNDWFVDPPACSVESGADHRRHRWWGCPGLAVTASEADLVDLGNDILDRQGQAEHPRDREILVSVGTAALLALSEQLSGIVDPEQVAAERTYQDVAADGHIIWHVRSDRGWAIDCLIGPGAALALRRQRAGTRATPDPVGILSALQSEEVELGCHLGEAKLALGDLRQLARGDLLVLSSRTDDELPLTVQGSATLHGKAQLSAEAGRICVKITHAPEIMQ